jgi:hypothetical protein
MILPIKAYVEDLDQTVDLNDLIGKWMEENRELLHKVVMEGSHRLEKIPNLKSVCIIELYTNEPGSWEDETDCLLAEISVDTNGVIDSLEECKKWYVETEQYELAAECHKLQETFQKRKYE